MAAPGARAGFLIMRGRGFQAAVATGLWATACWPLWAWYVGRIFSVPEQSWLTLAPVTAFFLILIGPTETDAPVSFSRWIPPILLMAVYGMGYPFVPMTVRALLAVLVFLAIPGPWRPGVWPLPAVAGLCIIGLPAVTMLQFYFGYPLRALVSVLAAPILRLAGFEVIRDGVMLAWRGETIGVDVPCSGIRMGWMGLYLAFTAAGLARLGWWRTAVLVFASGVLVVAANTLRVAALFIVEALGYGGRPVLHAGIGVMLFLLMAFGMAAVARLLARNH